MLEYTQLPPVVDCAPEIETSSLLDGGRPGLGDVRRDLELVRVFGPDVASEPIGVIGVGLRRRRRRGCGSGFRLQLDVDVERLLHLSTMPVSAPVIVVQQARPLARLVRADVVNADAALVVVVVAQVFEPLQEVIAVVDGYIVWGALPLQLAEPPGR